MDLKLKSSLRESKNNNNIATGENNLASFKGGFGAIRTVSFDVDN